MRLFENPDKAKFLVALALLLLLQAGLGQSIDFHRNMIGVDFQPYVHNSSNPWDDWKSYTLDDMKTMMKVVSTRFNRISTFHVAVGMFMGLDINSTNDDTVYYGDVAALVNKELEPTSRPLVLILGISLHLVPYGESIEVLVNIALDSAKRSNSIYPGTVQGLAVGHTENYTDVDEAEQLVEAIKKLKSREETTQLQLRVGARHTCEGLGPQDTTNPTRITASFMEMVKLSDFILCMVDPFEHRPCNAKTFDDIKTKLLEYKKNVKAINPRIEVMGQTGCYARATNESEVTAMLQFWQLADEWAAENEFPLFLFSAFDYPWKNKFLEGVGDYGWWKLTNDSKTGMVEGYLEKTGTVAHTLHYDWKISGAAGKATQLGDGIFISAILFLVYMLI